MKLSKAQQEVMDKAKERIDYARTHSFHDWFRNNTCADYVKEMSDQEVDALIDKRTEQGWIGNRSYEENHYQMNRDGIDYLCHASGATIKKLETLGLIEIIKDSTGTGTYAFDAIKVLNY